MRNLNEMITDLKKDVKTAEIRIFTMDYREDGFEEGGYVCLQAWLTLKDGKKGHKELKEWETKTYKEAVVIAKDQMKTFKKDLSNEDWVTFTLEIN